ncbi:ribonuclease H-like domain-containing protein [Tanacetum coccineum]
MKAVKEKEQLHKTVDSWKDSSKNLWKLVNSGMTSNSKVGLGYGIKSNNEVLSYEEEMNHTVFNCTEEDFVAKPLYNRFSKTDNLKGVPHPLTRDYTPKPQLEIDKSFEGSFGNPSEHSSEFESESISVPKEMSASKSVTTNEKVVSEPKPKDVEPSCVTHVKTPRQPMKNQETPKVNRKNWNKMMERELGEGYFFIKKKCFVCGSLSHLIRDCDFYEKKMAREAELKKQRVFNTGNGVAKPVWNNANRVNHANYFVPRPVQLNAVRPNSNSVRPNVNTGRANVNTGRANVNSVRQNVNSVRSNVNTVRPKQPVPTSNSNSFSSVRPQGNWGTAVKTSAGYNWRNTRPNSNCNSGSNFVRTDHPLKNMEDRGILYLTKKIFRNMKRGFRGVPRPLLPAMLPVVDVDQGAGQADQAVTQPSSSEPLPSSSPPPVLSATTESEPTPVAESTSHPNSLSPEPDNEPIEHTFEQPSSEHQPLLPRQETEIP